MLIPVSELRMHLVIKVHVLHQIQILRSIILNIMRRSAKNSYNSDMIECIFRVLNAKYHWHIYNAVY